MRLEKIFANGAYTLSDRIYTTRQLENRGCRKVNCFYVCDDFDNGFIEPIIFGKTTKRDRWARIYPKEPIVVVERGYKTIAKKSYNYRELLRIGCEKGMKMGPMGGKVPIYVLKSRSNSSTDIIFERSKKDGRWRASPESRHTIEKGVTFPLTLEKVLEKLGMLV